MLKAKVTRDGLKCQLLLQADFACDWIVLDRANISENQTDRFVERFLITQFTRWLERAAVVLVVDI
jgi:hypothetical protein